MELTEYRMSSVFNFLSLKGLCNWFFFFTIRLKIVSREEKVEKNQQIVEKKEK